MNILMECRHFTISLFYALTCVFKYVVFTGLMYNSASNILVDAFDSAKSDIQCQKHPHSYSQCSCIVTPGNL